MASNNPEAEEVSRVNKLLQIKDLAWSRQLEKAVSGFCLFSVFFFFPNHVVPPLVYFFIQPIPYLINRDLKILPSLFGTPVVSSGITKSELAMC